MRGARWILRLCAITIAVLALASASIAGDDGYQVIVNPENPVDSVDRDFLRDAFLKKTLAWSDGESVRPIDLPSRYAARDRFTQEVVRKSPAQLKSYWNQQIFSGKGVPPPEAGSVADVLVYVLGHKGAVGYVPVGVNPGR